MPTTTRAKARLNLQVATVNVALERQLITLDPAPVEAANFEFELAGLPVRARLHDAGFEEVGFHVMVAPTEGGRESPVAGYLHWPRKLNVDELLNLRDSIQTELSKR